MERQLSRRRATRSRLNAFERFPCKYADKWEVLAPDGRILGTRVLFHPHEDEQPFTRDLGGVAIPADVSEVRVRAHDKVEGWGGVERTVRVPR